MGLAKHKTRMLSSPTLYPSKILTPWEKLCILRPALEKLDLGKTVTRPGERSRTLGNLGNVSQLSQLSQVSQGQVTVWGLMVLLCVSAEAGGKQRSDPCSTSNVHHVGGRSRWACALPSTWATPSCVHAITYCTFVWVPLTFRDIASFLSARIGGDSMASSA